MAAKIEFPKVVTARGVAVFPHLVKPDTKYKTEGEYKVRLRVGNEAAEDMVARINAMLSGLKAGRTDFLMEDDAKRLTAALKAKKLKAADLCFVSETDDEGNQTGNTLFNLKAGAQFKDSKTGEMVKRKIKFIDADKEPFFPKDVWGGSELKVRVQLRPWVNAKSEYGVKLAIDLVQVLKLVGGGGGVANTDGFDKEEGYSAPRNEEAESEPSTDNGAGEF